jgi:hypothetical protein
MGDVGQALLLFQRESREDIQLERGVRHGSGEQGVGDVVGLA